jgi:hypothetical protein
MELYLLHGVGRDNFNFTLYVKEVDLAGVDKIQLAQDRV